LPILPWKNTPRILAKIAAHLFYGFGKGQGCTSPGEDFYFEKTGLVFLDTSEIMVSYNFLDFSRSEIHNCFDHVTTFIGKTNSLLAAYFIS
jgi:hypothetical protein